MFCSLALGQSVKEWRVWPGWDQEQHFPLPLPFSAEPGDQVNYFQHGLAGHQGYLQTVLGCNRLHVIQKLSTYNLDYIMFLKYS